MPATSLTGAFCLVRVSNRVWVKGPPFRPVPLRCVFGFDARTKIEYVAVQGSHALSLRSLGLCGKLKFRGFSLGFSVSLCVL